MKSERAGKADVLQVSLILVVLRTLNALGSLYGYGITRRMEQTIKPRIRAAKTLGQLMRLERELRNLA